MVDDSSEFIYGFLSAVNVCLNSITYRTETISPTRPPRIREKISSLLSECIADIAATPPDRQRDYECHSQSFRIHIRPIYDGLWQR